MTNTLFNGRLISVQKKLSNKNKLQLVQSRKEVGFNRRLIDKTLFDQIF